MSSEAQALESPPGVVPAAQAPGVAPPPPPTTSKDVVIDIRDLGKCYHIYDKPADRLKQSILRWKTYHRDFWALRDISLQIHRGEVVGVIGRNGSGKSTLMQIIAGVLSPTTGTVGIRGRVAALLELGSGFNLEFTGRENVFLYGSILGMSRREMLDRFDAIAGFADIGRFMDQPVKTYSSGMRIRLAFSVQVQLEPEVLIIDEALSVGDNLFQKRCQQRLQRLAEGGTTLLFVSHSQETIRTLTTRALLLHHGRARAVGDPAEILLDYRRILHDEEKRWAATRTKQFQQQARQAEPAATPATAAAGAIEPKPGAAQLAEEVAQRSFGDLDAQITAVTILDEQGDEVGHFQPGERITIRVTARINRPLTHLNIALRLRSKEGVKVYSWGTLNQDIALWANRREAPRSEPVFWDRQFDAGEDVTVDFDWTCCVGNGFYEVQVMLAEERDAYYGDERMLHWLDEAAFFTVRVAKDEYYFGGIADLRMEAHVTRDT